MACIQTVEHRGVVDCGRSLDILTDGLIPMAYDAVGVDYSITASLDKSSKPSGNFRNVSQITLNVPKEATLSGSGRNTYNSRIVFSICYARMRQAANLPRLLLREQNPPHSARWR